jgi:SAM-dependent methyltransferase
LSPLGHIEFTQAPVVDDRFGPIARFAARGAVLDVGCIDERHPERIASSLHARLRGLNAGVVGLDGDARAVEAVRRLGFEVRLADASRDPLGGPYDCIVAGEVLEHLENPGDFLDNAREALSPGGTLVLTTPNPFRASQFFKILKHGEPQIHPGHTLWFDPRTLAELLDRRGFVPVEFAWIRDPRRGLRRFLARFRPYLHAGFLFAARRKRP